MIRSFSGVGLTIALTLAITIVGYAQKSVGEPSMARKDDDQAMARQEVAKSVPGGLVLDAVTVKEPDWVLFKGAFMPKIEDPDPAGVVMTFKNAGETIHISIFDFGTADRAENAFLLPRSMGTATPITLGDRGEKVYIEDRMTGLNFRVGNLRVRIGGTNDEGFAERFAGHVLEAIKGLAFK